MTVVNIYSHFSVNCSASPPSVTQDHFGIQAGKLIFNKLMTKGKLMAPALLMEIQSLRQPDEALKGMKSFKLTRVRTARWHPDVVSPRLQSAPLSIEGLANTRKEGVGVSVTV